MNLLKPKYEIGGHKYIVTRQIGEGAYAFVYSVKRFGFGDHPQCALKKLICQTDEQLEEAEKEIKLLSEIRHPNVLHLLGSDLKANKKGQTEALLLMPLYQRTVQDLIDAGPGFPKSCFSADWRRCIRICVEFCNGLQAIHAFGYRHCDFKPANVLLRLSTSGEEDVVITDLGSASPLSIAVTSRAGALAVQESAAAVSTASYRAPELLDTPSECTIDAKTDVWAVGCTIYNMLFSRTPFENPVEGFSLLAACGGSYRCPSDEPFTTSAELGRGVGLSAIAVAQACLLTRSAERPRLQQVLGMLECCQSMPPAAAAADPACSMHAPERKDPVLSVQPSTAVVSVVAQRERVRSTDSMDEFGDFEGAPVDGPGPDADDTGAISEPDAPAPTDSYEKDRDSLVSNIGIPTATLGGKVLFEGPIHVMRLKGGISHKMINKTVWGILTERGITVRKLVDPSSKVHAALPFYSAERADCSGAAVAGANSRLNISVTKGISIVDGGVSKEIVEGLGPYVLSVSVAPSAGNQSCESECLSPNITYQRAASDTLASRAASAVSSPELGPKRRKSSILSFGSPVSSNESGKDVKQPLPTRRRSVAMFSAFNGGQPSHNGNVELLDFGVDSAKMMNQWYNAIFEISRSDKI